MSARRYSGRPFVVTASIDNITFGMQRPPTEEELEAKRVQRAKRWHRNVEAA